MQNHRRPSLTFAHPRKYRTICDLPFELLDIIISYVKADKRAVWACTLVCHFIRAVSLEHYFGTRLGVEQISSFDHLFSFLAGNPRVCAKTRRLRISGKTRKVKKDQFRLCTPLDDTVVLRLMQLLPNLENFDFTDFIFESIQASVLQLVPRSERVIAGPFHLRQLFFNSGLYTLPHECSTSVLFAILSLFTMDELLVGEMEYDFEASAPLDLAYLHHFLSVKKLHIDVGSTAMSSATTGILLRGLAESVEPGTLCTLDVRYHTVHDVDAIGKLLTRAGEGLTSLTLRPRVPYDASERRRWKDPLDSTWLPSFPSCINVAESI